MVIDLRCIIVVIKIVLDVECMVDFVVNVVKLVIWIGNEELIKLLEYVKKMYDILIEMLSFLLKVYYEEDFVLVKKVVEMDD